MDIHDHLGVLRRGWALLLLGLLVGVGGGAVAQSLQVPSYAATTRDLITYENTGDLARAVQASSLAQNRIGSYVLVASSGLVLQPVIDQLGLAMTVRELAAHLTVVAPAQTLVVEITATAATPQLARDIANATSRSFGVVVANQIEAVVATTTVTPAPAGATVVPNTPTVHVVNIEAAALPTAPQQADSGLFVLVGGILGLGAGLVGVSLRESLDRRIRGRKDISAVTKVPVIGQVRSERTMRANPLVVTAAPQSAVAESLRTLRANLDHVRKRDNRHSFVITAVAPGHGTTSITANLALAVANTATTVVLVDANVRTQDLTRIYGADGAPGLTDVLIGRLTLDGVLRAGPSGIWIVPAGSRLDKTEELLATPAMGALLTELRSRFAVVLIDAPSIAESTDATVLGALDNSTLLVVAEGAATRPVLVEAIATLAAGGTSPVGVILDRIPRRLRGRRAGARGRGAPARLRGARPVVVAKSTAAVAPAAVVSRFAPEAAPPQAKVEPAAPPTLLRAVPPLGRIAPVATSATGVAAVREIMASSEAAEVGPRHELRTPRRVTVGGSVNVTAINSSVSRERQARESYLLKSRELERAANVRLAQEQARLEVRIREQLDAERRELGTELDDLLEDTRIIPRTIEGA